MLIVVLLCKKDQPFGHPLVAVLSKCVLVFLKHEFNRSVFFSQDVGFSKEYEEVRADSCLDEYTAQDAQQPENKDKNRYPNIVACEYSMEFIRRHCYWGGYLLLLR